MKAEIRKTVRQRAGNQCEYCRLSQSNSLLSNLQVEHIIACQHGGKDQLSNLALACGWCNRHKGPNLSGIDPTSGELVPLFNPRQQVWSEHFDFRGATIVGITPVGRATVFVLDMNAIDQVRQRTTGDEGYFT